MLITRGHDVSRVWSRNPVTSALVQDFKRKNVVLSASPPGLSVKADRKCSKALFVPTRRASGRDKSARLLPPICKESNVRRAGCPAMLGVKKTERPNVWVPIENAGVTHLHVRIVGFQSRAATFLQDG